MAQARGSSSKAGSTWPADKLADGVLILFSLAAVQRLVGFCRTLLFCRWLEPGQLGQWDMAFGFLTLAAPVAVLGISGSFGRYVEFYRQRGQLGTFLRRTACFCTLLAITAAIVVALGRREFSRLIFGSPGSTKTVLLLAAGVTVLVLVNYLTDLFTALRNMRVVALIQLTSSVSFAVLGIGLVAAWQATAFSVVLAYVGASLMAAALALACLARGWRRIPVETAAEPHRRFWARLAPFAAWIWVGNLLVNLFLVADRYMIIHFSGASAERALVLVGHYHSALVLPLLLVSMADMLGAMIMPHLSHDWEAGRPGRVVTRLNLVVKLFGLALLAASVFVLAAAPILFHVGFRGKFSGGLSVLPWTLTYCMWFGMLLIVENYLYCAERARLVSVGIFVGLAVNIGMNLALLPRFGLLGAVLATAMGHLTVLVLVLMWSHRLGFRVDRGTRIVMAAPLVVCLGPAVAAAVLAALILEAACSDRFLTAEEKRELGEVFRRYGGRLVRGRMRVKSTEAG